MGTSLSMWNTLNTQYLTNTPFPPSRHLTFLPQLHLPYIPNLTPFPLSPIGLCVSIFLLLSPLVTSFIPNSPMRTNMMSRGLSSSAASDDAASSDAPSNFLDASEFSSLTAGVDTIFGIEEIEKILPHRYPFALVDKVISYEPGKRAVGIKSVTLNEPQVRGGGGN